MTKYLDIWELGGVLGRPPETIKRQMRNDPRHVTPRMHILLGKNAAVKDGRGRSLASRKRHVRRETVEPTTSFKHFYDVGYIALLAVGQVK